MFPTSILEALPHDGLPEWQYRQHRAAINRFHALGGVLDFQQFAYTTAAPNETERRAYHLATAQHTLAAVIAEHNEQSARRLKRLQAQYLLPEQSPLPISQHFSLQSSMGQKISAEQFYGNQLDLAQSRLIVRDWNKQSRHFGQHFHHDSQTSAEPALARNPPGSAFCHAFLNPPYPPQFGDSPREVGEYFLQFCRQLFGSLSNIEAYAWDTDCSNYFDDGREWWGAYFWTVYSPANGRYTGIMGSATD
ncbi:hypothetical protein A7P95_08230 [Eikenella longinqua]|uniref:Uncharacterized protein n=1 Tax=Eikenella longinqua TaxID=1795827 RepID=A0A1A9RX65_9NEIS|nr:hypothetical protein [Eikenella longinqua]OAM26736.1 hypothetical protein A7P95_08230 [Eikenella longinqua]